MTSRDFCYWLQGCLELNSAGPAGGNSGFSAKQVEVISRHLNLVFKHEIDPSFGDETKQKVLSEIHSPTEQPQNDPPEHLKKVLQHPQFRPHDTLIRC